MFGCCVPITDVSIQTNVAFLNAENWQIPAAEFPTTDFTLGVFRLLSLPFCITFIELQQIFL